jgi:hypothetical protein
MQRALTNVDVYQGEPAPGDAVPPRGVEELWFALAQRRWSSVVLVPTDDGTSAAVTARALATVGNRLRQTPVTAVVADSLDYATARALTELQSNGELVRQEAVVVRGGAITAAPEAWLPPTRRPRDPVESEEASPRSESRALARALPPTGQLILAIRPVVADPVGLAVVQAADGAILCVEMGRSRLRSVRRTIELVGRERILGCALIHPAET